MKKEYSNRGDNNAEMSKPYDINENHLVILDELNEYEKI